MKMNDDAFPLSFLENTMPSVWKDFQSLSRVLNRAVYVKESLSFKKLYLLSSYFTISLSSGCTRFTGSFPYSVERISGVIPSHWLNFSLQEVTFLVSESYRYTSAGKKSAILGILPSRSDSRNNFR